MKTVYKYKLPTRKSLVVLPKDAKVLHAGCQQQGICLWAEVDPEIVGTEERLFIAYGTGDMTDISPEYRIYLNTVFIGHLVWHVYEILRPDKREGK